MTLLLQFYCQLSYPHQSAVWIQISCAAQLHRPHPLVNSFFCHQDTKCFVYMLIIQLLRDLWRKQQEEAADVIAICALKNRYFSSSSAYSAVVIWTMKRLWAGWIGASLGLSVHIAFPVAVACFSVHEGREEKGVSQWCLCLPSRAFS